MAVETVLDIFGSQWALQMDWMCRVKEREESGCLLTLGCWMASGESRLRSPIHRDPQLIEALRLHLDL